MIERTASRFHFHSFTVLVSSRSLSFCLLHCITWLLFTFTLHPLTPYCLCISRAAKIIFLRVTESIVMRSLTDVHIDCAAHYWIIFNIMTQQYCEIEIEMKVRLTDWLTSESQCDVWAIPKYGSSHSVILLFGVLFKCRSHSLMWLTGVLNFFQWKILLYKKYDNIVTYCNSFSLSLLFSFFSPCQLLETSITTVCCTCGIAALRVQSCQ